MKQHGVAVEEGYAIERLVAQQLLEMKPAYETNAFIVALDPGDVHIAVEQGWQLGVLDALRRPVLDAECFDAGVLLVGDKEYARVGIEETCALHRSV